MSVGKTTFDALWDTGAQISLIDHRLLAKIFKDNVDAKTKARKLPTPQISVRGANGSQIEVLAYYHLTINCGKKLIQAPFLVVKNLATGAIIGCDVMEKFDISINMRKHIIKFGKTKRDLKRNDIRFFCHRDIKLEAKSETLIKTPLPWKLAKSDDVLYQQRSQELPTNTIIEESITKVRTEKDIPYTFLNFVNLNDHPILIKRGSCLGRVSGKESFEAFPIESITQNIEIEEVNVKFKATDLNLENIPACYQSQYLKLVNKYSDVFSVGKIDVGNCPVMPHVIRLKDPSKVVSIPPYRMPYHLQAVAKDYVDNLLKANIIRRSTSPFSSPLMLVRKANADPSLPITQQYRVVHNYKKVNENITRCAYPLRNLYELIDNVAKGKVYTVIDLSQGYFNQQCIDPEGASAFSVPGMGHFEYVKSPMGINSSPAYFQRLLDYITRGLDNIYVYMDDVIISTQTHSENLASLEKLLKRFRKFKMKCNLKKTKFGVARVEYLGYDISKEFGIRPGKLKTEVIKKCQPPTSVTGIKQFIGLCSFFRRVIPNFSEVAAPFNKLVRKDSGYSKGALPAEALKSFQDLKKLLSSRPCV